jgi:hypothetical protein
MKVKPVQNLATLVRNVSLGSPPKRRSLSEKSRRRASKKIEVYEKPVRHVEPALRKRRRQALKHPLSLEEVQMDLMRLEGRVSNRLDHAFERLEATENIQLRHTAMARRLAYAAATLDITVAPNPELNLFDMIAFLEISRSALNRYWIPKAFGPEGDAVLAAFEVSIHEAWKIAGNVISTEMQSELSSFIFQWIEHHPDHYFVDTLRFSQFPESMREEVPNSDSTGIQGLIQHANRALTTADATRLLAERAFFYAQRAPFLMRLQARVATYELFTEGYRSFQSTPMPAVAHDLRAQLDKAPELLNQAHAKAESLIEQAERSGIKLITIALCLFFPLRAAFMGIPSRQQKIKRIE